MSGIENVAMHMVLLWGYYTTYVIKQFLCSIKMMPRLESRSESKESRKIGGLRSSCPEAHRSSRRGHGICRAGCFSSSGVQHAGAARILGVKKEMGCLHNPPHIGCEERARSRRRDPGIRNTGCVSSSGVQHAGAVLALGTKKRDRSLARSISYMVPRRGLEPPHLTAHGPEPCASTNSAIWAAICKARNLIVKGFIVNEKESKLT